MEIDWVQAQLNDWSYCFSVSNDGTFCGRASYWFGHPEDHEFETLDDYLSFRREDCRWIDSKLLSKCERLEAQLSRAERIEAAARELDTFLVHHVVHETAASANNDELQDAIERFRAALGDEPIQHTDEHGITRTLVRKGERG